MNARTASYALPAKADPESARSFRLGAHSPEWG